MGLSLSFCVYVYVLVHTFIAYLFTHFPIYHFNISNIIISCTQARTHLHTHVIQPRKTRPLLKISVLGGKEGETCIYESSSNGGKHIVRSPKSFFTVSFSTFNCFFLLCISLSWTETLVYTHPFHSSDII
ncbi:hypothetical protein B0J11DRAFT_257254 [Dendryphion nanum]|uniref:Uncharacterized protein n=1 Tax=Dendryphion nanum TaxID=256645 RepID=A0A9P9E4L0_9PLEO|nr:hypothetical protein B0J11DRAFT_257254 [Dendryphion nanum]